MKMATSLSFPHTMCDVYGIIEQQFPNKKANYGKEEDSILVLLFHVT
jgi:hypothetical protein